MGEQVRAAGGVLWRPAGPSAGDGADEEVEVLLVHRPKYDDWSFPKGKHEAGEHDEDCARREVEEETGFRPRIEDDLGESAYLDQHGREKVVRYFVMTVAEGAFAANDEVDEVRWLGLGEARSTLTYDRDRTVLDAFGHAHGRLPRP